MTEDPDRNVQRGIHVGDGMRASDDRVATGDRREEVHYEQRPGGELRADHLKKPAGPLPPDMAAAEDPVDQPEVPVQDVAVDRETRSVWDARPVDDGHEHPGKR